MAVITPNTSGRTRALEERIRIVHSERVKARAFATSVTSDTPTISQSAPSTGTLATLISPYSPLFRVSGAPIYDQGQGASVAYPRSPTNADGSVPGPWQGSWRVEFDFDGLAFEFRTFAASNIFFRLWIDDVPHALTPQAFASITNASSWVKATFATRRYRRIAIEQEGAGASRFNGLRVAVGDTVLYPQTPSPRVVWIGDSYAYNGGAVWKCFQFPTIMSYLLGWADTFNYTAIPSTGLVQPNAPAGNYMSRFAPDVATLAPDIVFIQGSINDATTWPGNQASVAPNFQALIRACKALPKPPKIITTSPLYCKALDNNNVSTVRDLMAPIAALENVPFIDLLDGTFSGTGWTGSPTDNGNGQYYAGGADTTDKTHPSPAGQAFLAQILAGRVAKLLKDTSYA